MKVPFLIFCLLLILLNTCSVTDPVFKDHEMMLIADAEVTETWIILETDGLIKNALYTVKRDSIIIFEGKLDKNDTLIHDVNLEPATNYNYSAYARESGEMSETVYTSCTTMDTTSHDFTWQVTKVSDRLDINLQDVAIIDANNIYVVGFIPNENEYEEDYNVVHWDGVQWNLERIILDTNVGPDGPYEIKSIFSINNENIWIAAIGGTYGYWNGINWESEYKGIARQKIWGDSNNNLWFVGDNGKISHFDGKNWHTQESGTEIYLTDIHGVFDNTAGNRLIYVCGYNFNQGEAVILRKENLSEWQIFDNGVDGPVSSLAYSDLPSLWVRDFKTFFAASFSDVLKVRQLNDNRYKVEKILAGESGINRLRGNDLNDLFTGGENSKLRHFNGNSWRIYDELVQENRTVYSLDFRDNTVVAVSAGTIFIGRRN